MHNPSDETEQYDEPETIVQRHGGVELPFKHHEGGTAGGGDRGVDEAIKESNLSSGESCTPRTRRQVWKLEPNEPNLVKIEARTLGPTGTALLSPTCTDPRSAPQTSALTSFTPRFLEACESTVAARVAGVERRTLHPSPGRARRRASRARVPRARCAPDARQPRVLPRLQPLSRP